MLEFDHRKAHQPSAYQFVEASNDQCPGANRKLQRTVRSHAAKVSQPDQVTRQRLRLRRLNDNARGFTVFDVSLHTTSVSRRQGSLPPARDHQTSNEHEQSSTFDHSYSYQRSHDPIIPVWNILSGQLASPISELSVYHRPYVPGIMDHYIHNLTVPIPELDGSATVPLFRAVWLPIVVHDPLIFQIIVLFAATHYATYAHPSQFKSLQLELLSLKQSALSSLIRKVQREQANAEGVCTSSDTLIAAAAKMASYEAIFGDAEAVSIFRHG
jgi:hypothetical protein